jgi:ribonuclease G
VVAAQQDDVVGHRHEQLESRPQHAVEAKPAAIDVITEEDELHVGKAQRIPLMGPRALDEVRGLQEQRPVETRKYQPRTPIILPGESISKYRHQAPAAEASAPAEPVASEEPVEPEEPVGPEAKPLVEESATPVEPAKAEPEQPVEEQRPAEPRSYQPQATIVLPGESIAKYQQQEKTEEPEPEAKKAEETPVAATPAVEEPVTEASETFRPQPPRYERRPRREAPSDGTFTVLPGESISKYRKQQETEQPAAAEQKPEEPVEAAIQSEQQQACQTATFVIESEPWTEDLEHSESVAEPPVAAVLEEPESVQEEEEEAHSEAESGETSTGEPDAETPVAEADEDSTEEIQEEAVHAYGDHLFGDAGQGTLEHEEIEGEEEEQQFHAPVDEESDADDIELEEETLEADQFTQVVAEAAINMDLPGGDELTEEVDEPESEHPVLKGAYQEVDEETEFEEEELEHEPAFAEEQQETAIGQAEVHAAPQRNGRQQFDRRNRGRRGGHGRIMRRHEAQRQQIPISELLKEGQEVLVQIAKEPIGKKGARITSHIALPGRFLVYMPTITHIGVSRKITSDEERQRLKRIMISEREGGHGGFIVRTAAAGVGEDELRADIRFLKNLWLQIKQRSESGKAPALIYHDLNLVERILRDQVTSDFAQIWVDTEAEYERILNFANRFQPGLVRRVKLYTKETPLFEQFGIQDEINKSLKAKVWLKSGGSIVINQTEALVAIDINTGKYVGKTSRLEDTIVKTNIDATKEIVRQIRLRDLGGIIVVDFIDMDERRNRQKVMQALEEALKADRSPSKVLAFNDFGLVAITRKRVKQSLERTLGAPCPYCSGNGYVKSVTTVCNEIYVEMRKMASHMENDSINLRVNPEVAKALKAEKGKWLQDFEEVCGRPVMIKSDPLLHQEQFDIES